MDLGLWLKQLLMNGRGNDRRCPLCGWHGYLFASYRGAAKRADAVCPRCRSLERHRLAYVLLAGELRPGQLTLHVAPEPPLARWLSNLSAPGEYLSIDLDGPAMRRMDLTALDLPDASKTLVWCSHVLEHIPDDRKAMREMWRVLRPGGLAVIQVPLRGPTTYEDSSITTPQERRKAFMQEDHVRIYGMDVAGRLQQAGFTVDARSALHLPEALCRLHSLRLLGLNDVFVCTKAL